MVNDLTGEEQERFNAALQEAHDVLDASAEWQLELEDLTDEQMGQLHDALDEALAVLHGAGPGE